MPSGCSACSRSRSDCRSSRSPPTIRCCRPGSSAPGTPNGPDPYFLYASSNIGSFLALLSYPVLLEPMFTLRSQNLIWTGGYGLLIVLIAACGALLLRSPADAAVDRPAEETDAPPPSWMLRARWIFLAAVPSGLLIAVTAHISTDVAAAPFSGCCRCRFIC